MESAIDVDFLERPIDDPSQVVLHKEMMYSSTDAARDITFSDDFLDFAFTESGRLSEQKSLCVHNKFNFPIEVNWNLLPVYDKVSGK